MFSRSASVNGSDVSSACFKARKMGEKKRRRREVHIAMIYLEAFSRLSLRPASGSLSTISECESINHSCEPFPSHRRRRKKRNETDSMSQYMIDGPFWVQLAKGVATE